MAATETADVGQLTKEILTRIEKKELTELTDKCLKKAFERQDISLDVKQAQAKSWLHWARQIKHLKVVTSDVPVGVLPDGVRGQLHDVKVFTRRGPDDEIFDKNKNIRDKVARGNCFLEILGGSSAGPTCVVYALKKFTGGLGDDDDRDGGDNSTWKKYFLKPLDEAVSVVATRKANGEAAHFSARKIGDKFVICGGSKNVHMLFRNKADIDRHVESRFAIAREVSEAIWDLLESMSDEDKTRLLTFLSVTEFTAIFEILSPKHQHVEDLSSLSQNKLQFICWTSSELEASADNQLCSMPPHVAIEIAKSLNIPTVEYEVLAASDIDNRMTEVRQGYGYEGEVFYFLDAEQNVMGLLKKKTIWYILCRAIREKLRNSCTAYMKSRSTFSMAKSIGQVEKRINEIQTWLGLDMETTQAWKILGTQCLKWSLNSFETGAVSMTDIADLFPATWKRYLADTGQTDRVMAKWKEPEGSDE